jgi:putative DNA primase/helicase
MNDTKLTLEEAHIINYIPLVEEKKKKLKELSTASLDSLSPDMELPSVKIIPGAIPIMTTQAEALLMNDRVGIFQRAGQLVRIIIEAIKPKSNDAIKRPEDALVITSVDAIYLAEILSKLAKWEKYDQRLNDWKPKDCPDKVAKTLLARREWDLPVLSGIIQAPTLRPDGSILEIPGYDKATGLFFNPGQTQFQPIKFKPTKDDARLALQSLLYLIKEFPLIQVQNKEQELVRLIQLILYPQILLNGHLNRYNLLFRGCLLKLR